ncbi:type II toxin-antitoxin system antitoxin SocA domain-containing protein [Leptospira sp. 'Mane']|uniref:type II toxin-antitoxin system antitoxin SocA domain-containing protein n=1 Tax=Leptospira sp. 'Mane' TaxID=3387407 RepID=UPI00398A88FF
MEKLCHAILWILEKSPNGRARLDLAKLLYYSDGVHFQKHASMITTGIYVHLEDSPYPVKLNEALLFLKEKGHIDASPVISAKGIQGFSLRFLKPLDGLILTKEEKRVMMKVVEAFRGKVVDESRHYPNLYENYVVTPLYDSIPFAIERINTKIHVLVQKSLLQLSGKMFRVLFERSPE